MFGRDRGSGRRDARAPSQPERRSPVDILAQQMAVAKLGRATGEWSAYENARDTALRLVLSHRVEDEVSRFRQVVLACIGWQDYGEDARELIMKRLTEAFMQGVERGESAHDLLVRMQRIPRGGATAALVYGLRRGDGETCVSFLLFEDGERGDDVPEELGDDPAAIAATMGDRDWIDFVQPLLRISPGEPRDEVTAAARKSLLRALSAAGSR